MEDKKQAVMIPHNLLLQGRKKIELTGVKEVISFDAKEVVLNTFMGALVIRGRDLFVKRLTIEQGEIDLEGQIDGMLYADKPERAGDGDSLLKRLFR